MRIAFSNSVDAAAIAASELGACMGC